VEGSTIKYPIEDKLIRMLPTLHGSDALPARPDPKKVLIPCAQFEALLGVWEFFNNFVEFLEIDSFALEDLYFALNLDPATLQLDDAVSAEEVREKGVGLQNQLFCSIIKAFFSELPSEGSKEEATIEQEDLILTKVKTVLPAPDTVWPEILRMIMTCRRFDDLQDALKRDAQVSSLVDRLVGCVPSSFSSAFNFDEKLELLQFLVDAVHDLSNFRAFLNSRIDEKSGFNKQKLEVYAEIKQLENQKQDLIKEHAQSNFFNNSDEVIKEISELQERLQYASRVEGKKIKERIDALQAEKNKVLRERDKIDDQI